MILKNIDSGNISERKRELLDEAKQYKEAIDQQVIEIKQETFRVGKIALIVGGALAGSYLLYSLFVSGSAKNKNKKIKVDESANLPLELKEPKAKDSWLIASIKGYILTFLLSIAKEKITQAFHHIKEENAENAN